MYSITYRQQVKNEFQRLKALQLLSFSDFEEAYELVKRYEELSQTVNQLSAMIRQFNREDELNNLQGNVEYLSSVGKSLNKRSE
jgi:hypothetical protein